MASENLDFVKRSQHAAEVLTQDRERGERLFRELLNERPRDGAIHFYFAQALEDVGELADALQHYRVAEDRCRDKAWKKRASLGIERVSGQAALLQSWNFAYYQNAGPAFDAHHFAALEKALVEPAKILDAYRSRTIESLAEADRGAVTGLFGSLERVVQRVGAAKALHLYAPDCFPLWDNPIAAAYGIEFSTPGSKASEYCFLRPERR